MNDSDLERDAGQAVDWEAARQMTGGDDALLDELVALFPEESGNHLEAIRRAIELGDSDSLNRAAHTLKSAAKLFGASSLAACALTIENLAGKADMDEAAALVPELESELGRVVAALQQKPEA
jgi:HPt (histidine-containing phosphotransfer) domain-containing protein